jgi:precorrin-2 dehydrogenase
MAKYPIYLELVGKPTVVIGAGAVAARKVRSLCDAGAKVAVIAKAVKDDFVQYCKGLDYELITESYSKDCLKGAVIAIASTNDEGLNREIYNDCRSLGVLCNVVDVPELCDFYVPATVKRGDLQIAISTDGHCPAYAAFLRRKLENIFTEDHGRFLAELDLIRTDVIEKLQSEDRRPVLEELVNDESFDCFIKQGDEKWRQMAFQLIDRNIK